jgi:hypothetical protein
MANLHQQPTSTLYPIATTSALGALYDAPSPGPLAPMSHSTKQSVNLTEDDDAFVNIAMALLERYETKSLSVQDAVDSILLPHERRAFWEAVHFRIAKLPMYAEANEVPSNQVIRDVERIFGKILSSSTDMASPTSQDKNVVDSKSPSTRIEASASAPLNAREPRHSDTEPQTTQIPHTVTMSHVEPSPSCATHYYHSGPPQQCQQEFLYSDSNQMDSPHRPLREVATGGRAFDPSLASPVSVDTQPIQNLSSGEYYHNQHHKQKETHQQHENNPDTPTLRTSPPRYKQFRPPSVQTHPSFVQVMAPPTHIDIDWNIPIEIVEETTSPSRDKTLRFQERPELQPQILNEKPQSPREAPFERISDASNPVSPDWAPVISAHIADAENDMKTFDQHTFTRPLQENDNTVDVTGLQQRKKLLEEIDRVSKLLRENRVPEDRAAHESYNTALRLELQKWNRVVEFGSHQNSPIRSVHGGDENKHRTYDKVDVRFPNEQPEAYDDSQVARQTQPSGGEDSKKKPLLTKQVVARDQFPDIRKQWKMVNVRAPYTLPEVSKVLVCKFLFCHLRLTDSWDRH